MVKKWKSRKRREHSWWIPIFAAIPSALGLFLASVGWNPWLVVPIGILGTTILAFAPQIKELAKAHDESDATRHQSMLTSGTNILAPFVKDIPPHTWRIHNSRVEVPYLRRNAEEQVLAALQRCEPIIIIGPSMAGKTRMAAELVNEKYPDNRVLIPDAPEGVATLMLAGETPRQHIVWLDDLERYLHDSRGFKARWIQELLDNENIIIATMRATSYEAFMPSNDDEQRAEWDILQRFTKVHLFDDIQEKVRHASLSRNAQLSRGILNFGLGTYLGGGYLAVERLEASRSTNPLGRALVLAAIDWQRCGSSEPLPRATAISLVRPYLANGSTQVSAEEVEAGLAWATDKGSGGGLFSLLELSDENSLRPFEYLVDVIASTKTPIPSPVWEAALQSDVSAEHLNRVGFIANRFGEHNHASALFERAAVMGDSDGMLNYAISLERQDRAIEAMEWSKRAADAGNLRGLTALAVRMLREGKEKDAAEALLRQAAEGGESSAMANLGRVLLAHGDKVTGIGWMKRAAEAGSALGMVNYGMQLEYQGDGATAESWYMAAIEEGDASGAAHYQLAMLVSKRGREEEARGLLGEAVDRRNPAAMGTLGSMLADEGREAEAKVLFHGSAERGGAIGLRMVGRELAVQGKMDEAEIMFKRAVADGLKWATTDLGVLYAKSGRIQDAKEQYIISIEAGDDHALHNYGELLILEKKLPEGETIFRKASSLGSSTGMYLLSRTLFAGGKVGDAREAASLLEKAAILGQLDALCESGKRAADEGDHEKALIRLRRAADEGHTHAADCLGILESANLES